MAVNKELELMVNGLLEEETSFESELQEISEAYLDTIEKYTKVYLKKLIAKGYQIQETDYEQIATLLGTEFRQHLDFYVVDDVQIVERAIKNFAKEDFTFKTYNEVQKLKAEYGNK